MPDAIDAFITRWQFSGTAERSNYALFLSELCDLLPATGPDPFELAACFGKRTQPRIRTITEFLDTLTALGKL